MGGKRTAMPFAPALLASSAETPTGRAYVVRLTAGAAYWFAGAEYCVGPLVAAAGCGNAAGAAWYDVLGVTCCAAYCDCGCGCGCSCKYGACSPEATPKCCGGGGKLGLALPGGNGGGAKPGGGTKPGGA